MASTEGGRRPPGGGDAKETALAVALLLAAGLLAYSGSFGGPFIYDDASNIVQNPTLRHLWPIGRVLNPPVQAGEGGRPLFNLSLAVNYALSGESVWSYHAVNLAIHLLATLTLFGIVRRTIAGRPGALAVALLWELHPLQTEAVTYIVGRAEALMGLFYLLTLYCFIRCNHPHCSRPRWGRQSDANPTALRPRLQSAAVWTCLSVLCCLCGMATKEAMVTAPVLVLLYDRTFIAGSFRAALARRKFYYGSLAATWILLLFLLRGVTQRGALTSAGLPWPVHMLEHGWAVIHYLRLACWPHPLVLDYGMATAHLPAGAAAGTVAALILVALAGFLLWRNPGIGFLGASFFLLLAPSTSVVTLPGQPVAEHRLYLPLAAIVGGAVFAGERLTRRWGQSARLGLVAVAAALLAALTWARNRDYQSEIVMWSKNVRDWPSSERAQNNLGAALAHQGRWTAAMARYREALRLRPDYAQAEMNLGAALRESGQPAAAAEHLRRALQLDPASAAAEGNLGVCEFDAGRTAEALAHYHRALQLDPDYAEAHYNLGIALAASGRSAEAIAEYQAALALRTPFPEANNKLALALLAEGRVDPAIGQLELAIRDRPDFAEARSTLGNALLSAGRASEALAQYREAVRLDPAAADYHNNLGVGLFETGDKDGAAAEFAAALRLKPDFAAARKNLSRVRPGASSSPSP